MSKATRISLALFAFGVIAGVILVSYLAGGGFASPDAQPSHRMITVTVNSATVEAVTTLSGSALEVGITPTP